MATIDGTALGDELETLLRTAIPTLPIGTRGVERQFRNGAELPPAEYPHVFMHAFSAPSTALDFGQSVYSVTYQLDLWADVITVEDVLDLATSILEALDATVPTNVERWNGSILAVTVDPEPDTRGRRAVVLQVEGTVIA